MAKLITKLFTAALKRVLQLLHASLRRVPPLLLHFPVLQHPTVDLQLLVPVAAERALDDRTIGEGEDSLRRRKQTTALIATIHPRQYFYVMGSFIIIQNCGQRPFYSRNDVLLRSFIITKGIINGNRY